MAKVTLDQCENVLDSQHAKLGSNQQILRNLRAVDGTTLNSACRKAVQVSQRQLIQNSFEDFLDQSEIRVTIFDPHAIITRRETFIVLIPFLTIYVVGVVIAAYLGMLWGLASLIVSAVTLLPLTAWLDSRAIERYPWQKTDFAEFTGKIPNEAVRKLSLIVASPFHEVVDELVLLTKTEDPILAVKVGGKYYQLHQWR